MGLKLTCQGMWVARARVVWFAERRVIGSCPGNFLLASVFVGIEHMVWQHTLNLLPQSLITSTPQFNQELPCWHNYEEEEGGKAGQDEDQCGDSCHSGCRRYWWEYQGGGNQKDEEGADWIVSFITHRFRPHHFSLLVVSACLLHGVQMVNSRKHLLRKSHIRIDKLCSAYLSLHPLVGAWWWFWKYWSQNCPWIWGRW